MMFICICCVVTDNDSIKVAIKLSSNKRVTRRFRKTDPIRALFAYVVAIDPESASKRFELSVRLPTTQTLILSTCLDMTLDEHSINKDLVLHAWI